MYTQDNDSDRQTMDSAKPSKMPGDEKAVKPETLEKVYQQGGFTNRLDKMKDIVEDYEME